MLSVIFGYVGNKTHFCTMGAVSDIINIGDWGRMRAWLLAITVAIIGTNVLVYLGYLDISKTLYTGANFYWLAAIVGGATFGIGMTLAGGCGQRTLVRVGGGNLKFGPGGPAPSQDKETVGAKAGGRTVVPVNQVVTPHGTTSTLPGMRPQALAISPDGALLAVAGKTPELVIMDPVTLEILQEVPLPAEEQEEQHPETVSPMILDPDEEGQLSYTGLVFAPDGRRIYMSNVHGRSRSSASIRTAASSPRTRSRCRMPARRGGPTRSRPGWPSRPTAAISTSAAICPTGCS